MGSLANSIKWIFYVVTILWGLSGINDLLDCINGLKIDDLKGEPELYIYCVLCGISLIAAIVGIFGIWRENASITAMYVILNCLPLIGQVRSFMFAGKLGNIRSVVEDHVTGAWLRLDFDDDMNFIQEKYGCCGKNSVKDYDREPPESCFNSLKELYTRGCIEALIEEKSKPTFFNIVCLVINGLFILFGIFCFIRFLNKQRKCNH